MHRITLFPYLPSVLFPVWWLFSKYFPSISCIVLCTRAVLPIIFSNTDLAEQRNVSNLAQLFSIYFAQETKFGLTYNLREIFQTNHSFTDFVKLGFCTYDDLTHSCVRGHFYVLYCQFQWNSGYLIDNYTCHTLLYFWLQYNPDESSVTEKGNCCSPLGHSRLCATPGTAVKNNFSFGKEWKWWNEMRCLETNLGCNPEELALENKIASFGSLGILSAM